MGKYRAKGVITVFFTLLTAVFMGLFFMLLESARVQGARAQAANITSMGGYSVFGEYEKKLLEKFEIFAVDASYGSGDYSIRRVNDKLKGYMNRNLIAPEETLEEMAFDPWKLRILKTDINKYTILTDGDCESFYQQAVAYMKETPVTGITARLYKFYTDAQAAGKAQEKYEKDKASSDHAMIGLSRQEEEKGNRLDAADSPENGRELSQEEKAQQERMELARKEAERAENPMKTIAKLLTTPILKLVYPGGKVSKGKVGHFGLCSLRIGNKKGNLPVKKRYGGLIDNLLFREYLLDHFGDYEQADSTDGDLKYQLEYIICGKRTDEDNLKGTAKKLVLLRCGCNYGSCLEDTGMQTQAMAMAAVLIGWTGIPQLVEVLKHAILLGWSYAESLMDVRALLSGGRIPLVKSAETWQLSLVNLAHADELLKKGAKGCDEGLRYKSYLRLLLNMQNVKVQKRRGIDMAEATVRAQDGLSAFRADHCVVAALYKTDWQIDPVFDRVTGVLMGISGLPLQVSSQGGFAY